MTTVSPPKPWERAGVNAASAAGSLTAPTSSTNPTTSTSTGAMGAAPATATSAPTSSSTAAGAPATTSDAPELPSRPSTLTSTAATTGASPYTSRFGASPYSGMGGYSSYSSPYSRFGGGMYGGYGGGMYGGYGGMGGMGGMYGGMGGMGAPGDPNSLTGSFNQSTAATFQMLESIVGAFGGFAQMLESTYMATHSSFFAMVSVAEQFGNLKNTLGQVLGIYAIIRWLRTLFAKLTGRPPPADAMALTPSAFASFAGKGGRLPDGSPAAGGHAKPSRKPFFFFVAAVIGLPYLMGKLVKALARRQEANQQQQQQQQAMLVGMSANPGNPSSASGQQIDPCKLDFCRVLYDYTPDATMSTAGVDLAVKKGDLVAVLSRSDPLGNPSEWWKCRARDGSVGYLPSPYLETIQRKMLQPGSTGGSSTPSSRTGTMTGNAEEKMRGLTTPVKPTVNEKLGDISAESFQKSAFH